MVKPGLTHLLTIAGAALAISVACAQAADMPGGYPMPEPPSKGPTFLSSGWYLRADIGGAWGQLGSVEATAPLTTPTDNKLGGGMLGGIGVGIKTNWLRTDLTLDYLTPLKYTGTIAAAADTTAKIQRNTALLNGYFDLGTWYRLTPYIGAGAGAAYVHVNELTSTAVAIAGDTTKDQWKFAWAGMAGFAFAVAPNVALDVGYRYLNIGNVSSASNPTGSLTFKNVATHEVRVGVRWSFDDVYPTR